MRLDRRDLSLYIDRCFCAEQRRRGSGPSCYVVSCLTRIHEWRRSKRAPEGGTHIDAARSSKWSAGGGRGKLRGTTHATPPPMPRARVPLLLLLLGCAAAQRPNTASVQFMITQRMRGSLEMLGYNDADISALAPDRAAAIIERKIRRPRGGVPKNWTRSGNASPGRLGKTLGRWFGLYLPITLSGLCLADPGACSAAIAAAVAVARRALDAASAPPRARAQPRGRQRPAARHAPLYPWDER